MTSKRSSLQFEGFSSPNGTIVPDEFFDFLAPELSEAELRVCLYIIRRTFGFKKLSDDISLRQMVDGIRTKDGRVFDRGAGVVKSAASRAAKGLVEKGVVVAVRNTSTHRGFEPTTYALRFREARSEAVRAPATTPLSSRRTRDVLERAMPLSSKETHNKQLLQETDSSKGAHGSTSASSYRRNPAPPETLALDQAIAELSLRLGDEHHRIANRSQARNLFRDSAMSEEAFVGRMFEAFSVTKDRAREQHVRVRASYFFAVLRDLTSTSDGPEATEVIPRDAPATVSRSASATARDAPTSDTWRQVLKLLEAELSPVTLRTYFAHSDLAEIRDVRATVVAANSYIAEQLRERFSAVVRRALAAATGQALKVTFVPPTPTGSDAPSDRPSEPVNGATPSTVRARTP